MKIDYFTTENDERVELGDFTVLVGPNNTGKSQTLNDIHAIMATSELAPRTTIINEITYQPQTFDEFMGDLTIGEDPNSADRKRIYGIQPNLQGSTQQNLTEDQLETIRELDNVVENSVVNRHLSKFKVALLDASSRLEIAESTETYDLTSGRPTEPLQKLYEAPEARQELRDTFKDTFGMDILLDFSSLRNFILRVSDDFGDNENNLLEPPDDHSNYPRIDDQGAGFKSFAGVVTSLLVTTDRVVLLDEPEAFLHPAQARHFGNWMANHASEIPGQLIIATHNSHFLTGILSASRGVTIHRLNRAGNFTKYNTISEELTSELATDPLLSNQRIVEGVFHSGVVVCEADGDALIYRFVSETEFDEREFLFTHAHNKQTIDRITDILTKAAIPRAAIVDIDILKDPGEFGEILQSLDEGDEDFRSEMDTCNQLNLAIQESDSDWDDIKASGVRGIPDIAEKEFTELYEVSRGHGLFIVDPGELEGWIDLGRSKGPEWVIEALNVIDDGDCPDELRVFVSEIREYLRELYRELVMAE